MSGKLLAPPVVISRNGEPKSLNAPLLTTSNLIPTLPAVSSTLGIIAMTPMLPVQVEGWATISSAPAAM